MKPRYIFVTGGVVSSLGKGISAAVLGALLEARGYRVRLRKVDPYLNVDPGTMNPDEHGEVFVTRDGAETDLDLGHYERFTKTHSKASDNITAGRVYWDVLTRERRGDFLGKTVQVIPHVTDTIKEAIVKNAQDCDFLLCEIGGTIGDIEGLPFYESLRQFSKDVGRERCVFIHVTFLPVLAGSSESKTKPTQHSVKELRSIGVSPDILLCRTNLPITEGKKKKISLFCDVDVDDVIDGLDAEHLYQLPEMYHKAGLDVQVLKHLALPYEEPVDLERWQTFCHVIKTVQNRVDIAVVGKYEHVGKDAYCSIFHALTHAGVSCKKDVRATFLPARLVQEAFAKGSLETLLKQYGGFIVPGGFGKRGIDGKLSIARYAREKSRPFLGICYGMQIAVMEYARNVLGIADAGSTENDPQCCPVIHAILPKNKSMGGTMRLGEKSIRLKKDSLAWSVYQQEIIKERFRHRYGLNRAYVPSLEEKGFKITGFSVDESIPEFIELEGHPFYVGVQYHPEFCSRPFSPHPLFHHFVSLVKGTHSDHH